MKFLVDNQLPAALSRFLEAKNIESRHVLDLGLDEASDRDIWHYAEIHGYAIVSNDRSIDISKRGKQSHENDQIHLVARRAVFF